MRSLIVLILAVSTALTGVLTGCGPGARSHVTPTEKQQAYAETLKAARLSSAVVRPVVGKPITLRVKVYADKAFRRETVRWKDKTQNRFKDLNRWLQPRFGVQLKLVELERWDYEPPKGDDLQAVLNALEETDSGEEVDWVVGLTASLPVFTSSMHRMGMARVLGSHFVVRSVNHHTEANYLKRQLDKLPAAERRAIYEQRKTHKELTIWLHEWAHTLGAIHTVDPDWIMCPYHDSGQVNFSEANTRLILAALKLRHAHTKPENWRRALPMTVATHLEANHWSGWVQEEVVLMRNFRSKEASAGPRPNIADTDVPTFNVAVDLYNHKQHMRAWNKLAPLVTLYKNDPVIQRFGCQAAFGSNAHQDKIITLCKHASTLSEDALPQLVLANQYLQVGRNGQRDFKRANEALKVAEARLNNTVPKRATSWLYLAELHQLASNVSRAETTAREAIAIEKAGEIIHWATSTRKRFGLPHRKGKPVVSVDREGKYIELQADVYETIRGESPKAVDAALKHLNSTFPRTPGTYIAHCAVKSARGQDAQAIVMCRRAIALDPNASLAHYMLGLIEHRSGRKWAAKRPLKRAVLLDPSNSDAWNKLETLLSKKQMEALKEKVGKQVDTQSTKW